MATAHPVSFNELLRRHRRAAGLSQEILAQRAGLSRRAISDLERVFSRVPRQDTVELLAEALGLIGQERSLFLTAATTSHQHRASHPPTAAAGTTAPRHQAALTPLVGRSQELAELDRHLQGDGPPLLLLAGEPGIGKTRLLREAAERARSGGWCVLDGGCYRRDAQGPYAPLLGALAHYLTQRTPSQLRTDLAGCAWLVRLLPELAETAVVPLPEWTLPPEQERRLMFAAVGRFLANVAGPAGTLLVLDDLQWAGDDGLDLLASLIHWSVEAAQKASKAAAAPIQIVGAYRDTDVSPDSAVSLLLVDLARDGLATQRLLDRLDHREARALAGLLLTQLRNTNQSQSPTPYPPASDSMSSHIVLVEQIAKRSGGVPFFLVSCALGLEISGDRDLPDREFSVQLAPSEMPASQAHTPWQVTASIRQRIALLPRAAQRLLGALAVAGRKAPLALLATVLGRPEQDLVPVLEAACQARLLEETQGEAPHVATYQFTHDLIRETVLQDLSAARRTLMHRAVGDAIETATFSNRYPAEVAHHFVEAGEPARALPYALLAGDQAAAVYAHREAEQQYRLACACAREIANHSGEAEALAHVAKMLARQDRNEETLEVAEQGLQLNAALHDAEAQAHLAQVVAVAHSSRGTPSDGVARLQRLVHDLSTADLSVQGQARLYEALAWSLAWSALFTTGSTSMAQAKAALEAAARALNCAQQADDITLHLKALHTYGVAHEMSGHPECLQVWKELIPLAEAAGDVDLLLTTLLSAGNSALWRGQMASARSYCERALALTAQHDWLSPAWVYANYGEMEFQCGNWVEARMHFERGLQELNLINVGPQMWQGLLLVVQGDEEQAAAVLEKPLQWAEHHHHRGMLRPAHGVLAERELLAGRFEEARARLEPLLDPGGVLTFDLGFIWPQLSWAYVELGDEEQASATISTARASGHAGPGSPVLSDLLRIQALIAARAACWQEATDAINASLALTRALPYPYAEAKTLYFAGLFQQAQGATMDARTSLEAALAICDRLAEGMYRPHIARALAALKPLL
jgi:tetratricopeptide (TPR) repeat protein